MKAVVCPHCKAYKISTIGAPKGVVVVMPCPACHEWIVAYRNKVIALNRHIIENGARKERVAHWAEIIDEFYEAGFFSDAIQGLPDLLSEAGLAGMLEFGPENSPFAPEARVNPSQRQVPISDDEVESFVKIDLENIDDPVYFKKHFQR